MQYASKEKRMISIFLYVIQSEKEDLFEIISIAYFTLLHINPG